MRSFERSYCVFSTTTNRERSIDRGIKMHFLFAVKLNRCKLIRNTKQSRNTPEASSEGIKKYSSSCSCKSSSFFFVLRHEFICVGGTRDTAYTVVEVEHVTRPF